MSAEAPEYSPFFAVMGASAAMVFSGNITRSPLIFKMFVNYTMSFCAFPANPFCIYIIPNRVH